MFSPQGWRFWLSRIQYKMHPDSYRDAKEFFRCITAASKYEAQAGSFILTLMVYLSGEARRNRKAHIVCSRALLGFRVSELFFFFGRF